MPYKALRSGNVHAQILFDMVNQPKPGRIRSNKCARKISRR